MTVAGYTASEHQIRQILAAMHGIFTLKTVAAAAKAAGIPGAVGNRRPAYQLAKKLIDSAVTAGRAEYDPINRAWVQAGWQPRF